MQTVLWLMLFGALLGLVVTFVVEAGYSARAEKIQIVRIDHRAKSLFGPVTIDEGDPVKMIVGDPKALLKNKTALGYPMVDSEYLQAHPGAAIHAETVQSPIQFARIGCLLSALISIIGMAMLKRLRVAIDPADVSTGA
ncbi:MAG: hypothetical protein P4L46_17430 [Fimbriimonas sp.]|nr:hypothetical protein [Fimbriimonas sp.]